MSGKIVVSTSVVFQDLWKPSSQLYQILSVFSLQFILHYTFVPHRKHIHVQIRQTDTVTLTETIRKKIRKLQIIQGFKGLKCLWDEFGLVGLFWSIFIIGAHSRYWYKSYTASFMRLKCKVCTVRCKWNKMNSLYFKKAIRKGVGLLHGIGTAAPPTVGEESWFDSAETDSQV